MCSRNCDARWLKQNDAFNPFCVSDELDSFARFCCQEFWMSTARSTQPANFTTSFTTPPLLQRKAVVVDFSRLNGNYGKKHDIFLFSLFCHGTFDPWDKEAGSEEQNSTTGAKLRRWSLFVCLHDLCQLILNITQQKPFPWNSMKKSITAIFSAFPSSCHEARCAVGKQQASWHQHVAFDHGKYKCTCFLEFQICRAFPLCFRDPRWQ